MFRKILPFAFGLVLAGGLSQFPEFAQQYTQRVGGAYFEIRDVADGFRADAAASGKTVEQAIAEYFAAESTFFQDRGRSIQALLSREAYLGKHYADLSEGDGYQQLMVFTLERDMDIARDAFGIYKPAVPLTITGAAHAALGFLAGYWLLIAPGAYMRRRRRKKRAAAAA